MGFCCFNFLQNCSSKKNKKIIQQTRTDTVHLVDTVYVPKFKTVRSVDTVLLTDTLRIIEDYKQMRVYTDTLRDSAFTVFLTDTVRGNQIIARAWCGESYQRTTVITHENPDIRRWRYGVGAGGMYSRSSFAPAVVISVEKQRIGFFGIFTTSAIGAGVSLKF